MLRLRPWSWPTTSERMSSTTLDQKARCGVDEQTYLFHQFGEIEVVPSIPISQTTHIGWLGGLLARLVLDPSLDLGARCFIARSIITSRHL